jgi:hypothetical protein
VSLTWPFGIVYQIRSKSEFTGQENEFMIDPDNREKQSVTNYKKAIHLLDLAMGEPIITDRDRAGVVQTFGFTYELA